MYFFVISKEREMLDPKDSVCMHKKDKEYNSTLRFKKKP